MLPVWQLDQRRGLVVEDVDVDVARVVRPHRAVLRQGPAMVSALTCAPGSPRRRRTCARTRSARSRRVNGTSAFMTEQPLSIVAGQSKLADDMSMSPPLQLGVLFVCLFDSAKKPGRTGTQGNTAEFWHPKDQAQPKARCARSRASVAKLGVVAIARRHAATPAAAAPRHAAERHCSVSTRHRALRHHPLRRYQFCQFCAAHQRTAHAHRPDSAPVYVGPLARDRWFTCGEETATLAVHGYAETPLHPPSHARAAAR